MLRQGGPGKVGWRVGRRDEVRSRWVRETGRESTRAEKARPKGREADPAMAIGGG